MRPNVSFVSAVTAPLDQGAQVGPYEVVGHIASGGMGEVYLARRRGIGGFQRTVVLKVMLPHLSQDERFARMFVDEGRIAAGLAHPNIVQVYELDTSEEGGLYLAMEYLQGVSAIACIKHCADKGQWIPEEIAARVICDAAQGLHFAHEAKDVDGRPLGLVHRDISPENLFITYAGPTKLLDFGVAKVRDQQVKTQAGEFKGKVGYMAPEIIKGQEPDARADLFSLGVVFYELLTLRRLFHAAIPATALHRVLSEPIPPVRSVRKELDEGPAALVMQLLDRDRRRRVATAKQVADRLEEWLRGRQGTSNDVSRWLKHQFTDAIDVSARIAKAVERTGTVDPVEIKEARRLNGEALQDTVVREVSDEARRLAATVSGVGADEYERSLDRKRWLAELVPFLVVGAVIAVLGWLVFGSSWRGPPQTVWGQQFVEEAVLHDNTAGRVLRAKRTTDDRQYVLVVEQVASQSRSDPLTVLDQARERLAKLGDPGLPPPAELRLHRDGRPISAYALEEGRTLAQVMAAEDVGKRPLLKHLRSVAKLMVRAETGKLVHGWLSPELVWVTDTGQIRILGFRGPRKVGIAKRTAKGALRSPARLAPELRPDAGRAAGPAADQFALAAMLEENLRNIDQRYTEEAAKVLARGRALDPRARYGSTRRFVRAFDRALRRVRK